MTWYFGGYISKKQKVGQFEIKKSVSALPMFGDKLRTKKSASVQLAHVADRMFATLETKGILRAAPEEFMHAALYKASDELASEFIRTFRHQYFWGLPLLKRFDAIQTAKEHEVVSIRLPKHGQDTETTDSVTVYGFRPPAPDLFYLSPWEFCQWFYLERVLEPSETFPYSEWTAAGLRKQETNRGNREKEAYVRGVDYKPDMEKIRSLDCIFTFAEAERMFDGEALENHDRFRNSWVIIKRTYPRIPCPERTPLPSKKIAKQTRAKICSVYLRPWTLSKKLATETVPFLGDLGDANAVRTNWKHYLQRPLPHAVAQIRNFLMCCMAEGRHFQDEDDEATAKGPSIVCDLTLQDVHRAVDLQKKSQAAVDGPDAGMTRQVEKSTD